MDAGTPLGATTVVTPGSAVDLLLGVLHPGVRAMWYGHIRELFTTAEGCQGGRLPNVTLLHWAKQSRRCKAVMVWWMEVGWEGSPPHIIAHTMHAHAQVELFLSLPPWPCSWRDALCSQVCCRGNGWQAINPRCPGCLL